MSEKVYLGRSESKDTQYGKMHKVSFGPKDFDKMQLMKNEKGWLNCLIKESRDGNLYLEVDTWEPKDKEVSKQSIDDTDVPF